MEDGGQGGWENGVMRILVTGFEPFGSDQENASAEAVARLTPESAGSGVEVITTILPVSFARSGPALEAAVAHARPGAVLAVGEAGGRDAITPELWGVNCDHARIADNDGAEPRNQRIDDGPDRRPSGLTPESLVAAVQGAGLPARLSDDAGRFVCNHIAYLVAELSGPNGPIPGGFVHVPAVRRSGRPTVGAETDAGADRDAVRQPAGLTFDDLAHGLAACVTDIATRLGAPSAGSTIPTP